MTKSKILVCICLVFISGVLIFSLLGGFKIEPEKVNQYYDQEVVLQMEIFSHFHQV